MISFLCEIFFKAVSDQNEREASLLFNDDPQGDYEYPPKCRRGGTELHLPCPSCRRATELRFSTSHLSDLTCVAWRTGPAGVIPVPGQVGSRGATPNALKEGDLKRENVLTFPFWGFLVATK